MPSIRTLWPNLASRSPHRWLRESEPLRRASTTATGPAFNILFFGSDAFSVACLSALLEDKATSGPNKQSVIGSMEVVAPFGAAAGKSPLHTFASRAGLKCHEAPPKTLKGWEPPTLTHSLPFDLAVVVSFGYFLPQSLLSAFPRGGINVHPSLLPKFRGAAPIQHTILNGDTETGVSIIELHARKFDAGRILNQCKVPVPEGVYYKDLHDVLAARGAALLADTVRNLDQFERLAKTQEETMVMKAPKITKDMARIIWDQWTAEDIYRRYRAFGHQEPLHTTFKDNAVQIKGMMDPKEAEKAYGVPPNGPAEPGTIAFVKPANVLWVRCREGWAACTSFHPEYKKQQSAPNFKNGYRLVSMSDRFV